MKLHPTVIPSEARDSPFGDACCNGTLRGCASVGLEAANTRLRKGHAPRIAR
jgi:hypothetical protein